MKTLVYYAVGGCDPSYIQLVSESVRSVRRWNPTTDVRVLTDEVFATAAGIPPALAVLTPPNADHIEACMRKTRVFELIPEIEAYDAVLFLDADTVCVRPLDELFAAIAAAPGLLHVFPEHPGDYARHAESWWGHGCLPETVAAYAADGIDVFSAGTFGFAPGPPMRRSFDDLCDHIAHHTGPFFYEQSHMNAYFNARRLTTPTLLEWVSIPTIAAPRHRAATPGIVHIANAGLPAEIKLQAMRMYASAAHATRHASRATMHEALGPSLPPRPALAELGVFAGGFSRYLLDAFAPVGTLDLVDPWEPGTAIMSGNADGNAVEMRAADELYELVTVWAADVPEVTVHRTTSEAYLRARAPSSLDLVYIDADHTYEAVARDLALAWPALRPGGWLCGHDYAVNADKCEHAYDFGVGRAVDEFCAATGATIDHVFDDGCSSYAIRKRADAASYAIRKRADA